MNLSDRYVVECDSVAGLRTCIGVRSGKKFSIAFDIGSCPSWVLSANTVFISHTHVDHFGAIFSHARSRGLSRSGKDTVYFVPKESVRALLVAKHAFESLDAFGGFREGGTRGGDDVGEKEDAHGKLMMRFVPVEAGKTYELPYNSNFFVRTFRTDHRVPSIGYCIYEKTKGPLHPELVGKTGSEIRDWVKRTGRPANTKRDVLEIVYTGDTRASSLFEASYLFACRILIVEMTFMGDVPKPEKASALGHVHLDQLKWAIEKKPSMFDRVEHIVFVHFSNRYSAKEIVDGLRKSLPPKIRQKSVPALGAFGYSADECVRALRDDEDTEEAPDRGMAPVKGFLTKTAEN
eukprot:g1244.t1